MSSGSRVRAVVRVRADQRFLSCEAAVRTPRQGDRNTLRRNVPSTHFDDRRRRYPARVAKRAVRVSDSPGHSVTSLSLHRIGNTGSPPADRLIDTCWNSATALEDGGTVSVTVAMSSAPSLPYRRPYFARRGRQGLQRGQVRVSSHRREVPVRMLPVELVGLGWRANRRCG